MFRIELLAATVALVGVTACERHPVTDLAPASTPRAAVLAAPTSSDVVGALDVAQYLSTDYFNAGGAGVRFCRNSNFGLPGRDVVVDLPDGGSVEVNVLRAPTGGTLRAVNAKRSWGDGQLVTASWVDRASTLSVQGSWKSGSAAPSSTEFPADGPLSQQLMRLAQVSLTLPCS